jgi:hypothetical protein
MYVTQPMSDRFLPREVIAEIEKEHGGTLVLVCCLCQQAGLVDNALVLINQRCPIHSIGWHRPFLKMADGSLKSVPELERDVSYPETS